MGGCGLQISADNQNVGNLQSSLSPTSKVTDFSKANIFFDHYSDSKLTKK